jgi:hypothetical protein
MLGLSWPLWVEGPNGFPRVPFVARFPRPAGAVSWALFALLLGSIATAAAGLAWRRSFAVSLVVLTFLVLGDQHRFQAWVYQFAMVALLLATLPEADAPALVRGWCIATYAYSGLSKLDASFCHELGARFLEAACRPLGLDCLAWPAAARNLAILAMPAGELLVAAALAVPSTRRLGRAAAVVLHVALIAILGPSGLGHSTIVLVWNAAMLAEVWIAFDPALDRPGEDRGASWVSPPGWIGRGALLAGVLLPLGERSGYCDAWPGHALYASHVERTEVLVHEDEVESYPAELRRHVGAPGTGPWRRLDLTGWSRAARGVPAYPQARACNGLAEALAARYGDRRLIRVVQWGRADRWTGKRTRVDLFGLDAIRRQGDRYRLNAHPAAAPGSLRAPGP